MREDRPERRSSARPEADQERALEPAAMLVAAFEIDVGRPRQLVTERQHRLMARAGVEPHVEDVPFAFERRAAARRAGEPLGNELLGRRARTTRPRRTRRTPTPRVRRGRAVSTASPHFVQSTAGIGTPQARWREMHQSGRFVSMLKMRSRPQAGIHLASSIDRRAAPPAAASCRRRPARRPCG